MMPIRCCLVCVSLLVFVQPGLRATATAEDDEWTHAEAIDEIDALVVIERLRRSNPADRMARVKAWLKRVESSGLDLGKDAYVKAFALYLVTKKEEGPSARPTPSIECLVKHILERGGLPDEAGKKYGGWIDRILPSAIDEALERKEHAKVKKLLAVLARHGGRGAYGVYSGFGVRLVRSDEPADVKLLVEIVTMALADESLDAAMKGKLLKYLYSGDPQNAPAGRVSGRRRSAGSRSAVGEGAGARVPFVEFSGKTLDGKEISVRDFRGKVLLIDFWSTWCGPCMREMPNVVAVYEEFKDKGFEILGVSLDHPGNGDEVRDVMKKTGMEWPQIYEGLGWKTRPVVLNNIRSIPFTFLLDRQGKVRYTKLRGKALGQRVAELLSGKAVARPPEKLTEDRRALNEIEEQLGVRRTGNLIFCKKSDEGIEKLDAFLAKFKDSPLRETVLYLKAISLWGLSRYSEAAPVYYEFLQSWPDSDFARIARIREGAALLFSGQPERALPKLKALQKRYPDQPEGYARELASALVRCGKFEEARRFMDEVERVMTAAGKSRFLPRLQSQFEKLRLVGSKLQDFEVREHRSAKMLGPASFAGKVVLVDFWATWCRPCVAELPHLKATYSKYRKKGFEIFAVSLDSDRERLDKRIDDEGMEWLHYFDGKKWRNKLAVLFDIHSIPASLLIDRQGVIQAVNLRGAAVESWVEQLIEGKKGAPPALARSRPRVLPGGARRPAAAPPLSLKASSTERLLTLDVEVQSPWHVYGEAGKDGQPLRVEFLEGSSFSAAAELQLPAGKAGALGGRFRITVALKRTGEGDKVLAELIYQACNSDVCLPPKRIRIEAKAVNGKRRLLKAPIENDTNPKQPLLCIPQRPPNAPLVEPSSE